MYYSNLYNYIQNTLGFLYENNHYIKRMSVIIARDKVDDTNMNGLGNTCN